MVFSKMVQDYQSMECMRYSVQVGETWGPQDVDDVIERAPLVVVDRTPGEFIM